MFVSIVHFVVSRLNNRQVRIIDCRFESIMEMERLVRVIQQKHGVSERNTFRDYPTGVDKKYFYE